MGLDPKQPITGSGFRSGSSFKGSGGGGGGGGFPGYGLVLWYKFALFRNYINVLDQDDLEVVAHLKGFLL